MLTTKIQLNKVRQKNDGTYPLVIRITYNRKTAYLPLGYNLNEKEFDAKNQRIRSSSKIASNINRLNNGIQEKVKKVYDTFTGLEKEGRIDAFTMPMLKKEINGINNNNKDFFSLVNETIKELQKAEKYGNARIYKSLKNKIENFNGVKPLPFRQINYAFLKKMETEHFAAGHGWGGLSVYLRTLRAVYKKAIKLGIVDEKYNPFKNYSIKSGVPKRFSLSTEQLETLKSADIKEPHLEKARNLFMASFYLRGMNWMDMALLKHENVTGDFDRINYIRAKTMNKLFSIKITPHLKKILLKYSKASNSENTYVFPIVSEESSKSKVHATINNKRKRQNTYLKKIAKTLDLPSFTIYAARHTYANVLKLSGAPSNVIQDSLGHTTEAMTQAYLNSFETTIIDDYDAKIMG